METKLGKSFRRSSRKVSKCKVRCKINKFGSQEKKDDLQAVIQFVRSRDFGVATNFKNFRD